MSGTLRTGLDVGDEVVARVHLGAFLRRVVRRGTRGVVVAHDPDSTPRVAFSTGHVLRLDPADVAPVEPGAFHEREMLLERPA